MDPVLVPAMLAGALLVIVFVGLCAAASFLAVQFLEWLA